jgi:hypothetical protein
MWPDLSLRLAGQVFTSFGEHKLCILEIRSRVLDVEDSVQTPDVGSGEIWSGVNGRSTKYICGNSAVRQLGHVPRVRVRVRLVLALVRALGSLASSSTSHNW